MARARLVAQVRYRLTPFGTMQVYDDATDDPNSDQKWHFAKCVTPEWFPEAECEQVSHRVAGRALSAVASVTPSATSSPSADVAGDVFALDLTGS